MEMLRMDGPGSAGRASAAPTCMGCTAAWFRPGQACTMTGNLASLHDDGDVHGPRQAYRMTGNLRHGSGLRRLPHAASDSLSGKMPIPPFAAMEASKMPILADVHGPA